MYRDNKFTFQSGDIQILYIQRCLQHYGQHLHSNLVIFKYGVLMDEFHQWKKFTFQSGDIQITDSDTLFEITKKDLHSNLVIFKYATDFIATEGIADLHSNLVIFK